MTKYVFNSGAVRSRKDGGKAFFEEIVNGLGNNPKVLMCFFAEKREVWESKFQSFKTGFIELMPKGVIPEFELAFPDKFVEQIKNNDIVFVYGGDDHLLRYWFEKFDIPKIWEGKVVATTSAGSGVLTKYYWTCDWRGCIDGLGILPIKFIPHYGSVACTENDPRGQIDWKAAKNELTEYGDKSLPIHALNEGDFEVFEV